MVDFTPSMQEVSVVTIANKECIAESRRAKGDDIFVASSDASASEGIKPNVDRAIPLKMKLIAILLVTATGFGSHWSSGVTGAMKSTLKKARKPKLPDVIANKAKQLHINNAQYAVLEASEDFMKTALILVSGLVTDRIGGASQ